MIYLLIALGFFVGMIIGAKIADCQNKKHLLKHMRHALELGIVQGYNLKQGIEHSKLTNRGFIISPKTYQDISEILEKHPF
uniref:Uncharacterized protein n=1 Tax=viral metagenome TaxID=1070528 RepID=A0A6M3J2H8_9ZZZZ